MSLNLSTEIPLHPRQVSELRDERKAKERMLAAPEYIRSQLDSNGEQVARRIREIDGVLENQAPKPIPANDLDAAVATEKMLRERWSNGMPTQAEMRRNPAGAVDKHMAWEKRCKNDVLAWKNLRRRLHASGISEHSLEDENDVSNIEKYRPAGGASELNMHGEQITGKTFFGLATAAPAAVMSEAQSAVLKELSPDLHGQMAFLTADKRAETLRLVDEVMALRQAEAAAPQEAQPRKTGRVDEPQYRDKREMAKARGKKKSASYQNSELKALRDRAKELGINSFGLGTQALKDTIAAKISEGGND